MVVVFSLLYFHFLEMYASSVDAYRCPGFHPPVVYAVAGDGFGQMVRCRFGHTASGQLRVSDVHQAVQERAGRQDDAACPDRYVEICLHASHFSVLYEEFLHLVLPDMQIGCIFQDFPPCPDEFSTVALGAGAPHSRAFRTVEHTELYGGAVGHDTHVAAQSVYFPDDLSFGNASHGRIATHLSNLVHVHGDKAGLRSHVGRGCCRFAACMAAAYHYHIVVELHF